MALPIESQLKGDRSECAKDKTFVAKSRPQERKGGKPNEPPEIRPELNCLGNAFPIDD